MVRRHGLFVAALILQVVLLAGVPLAKIQARYTGRSVTLETRPVDPYDLLAGYYVTLAYAVELVPRNRRDPDLATDEPVWLELAPGTPAWTLVRAHAQLPQVSADHVIIRGQWRGTFADIPEASRLYIAETERADVDRALRSADGHGLVELRVGADGTPVPIHLRVAGRTFGDER